MYVIAVDEGADPNDPNAYQCQSSAVIELELDSLGRVVAIRTDDDMLGTPCAPPQWTNVVDFKCANSYEGQFEFTYWTFQMLPGFRVCDLEYEDIGFCNCNDFYASLSCSGSVSFSSAQVSSASGPTGPGDPPL